MTHLVLLRRCLLLGGTSLVLFYLCLVIGVALLQNGSSTIILPSWIRHVADVGLLMLVASLLIAGATRRGWQRTIPLLALGLLVALTAGLAILMPMRVEADQITLPDGRVVVMTYEPVPTDTVFAVWERMDGIRWRPLYAMPGQITYSEDGSFTADPRLVVSDDGRHLLLRRGGIWADCWPIGERPSPCPLGESPSSRDQWLERSRRITATVGDIRLPARGTR